MSQLDDLIKKYPFKCQKCEAEFTPVSLLASIITFGVVLLFGKKDGFIGWSCLECIGKTRNFNMLSIKPMHQLITAIRGILEKGNHGRLCYHSFPYRHALANGNFHRRFDMPIDDNFEAMQEDDTIGPEGAFDSSGMYCSYEFGSEALRPAISVWWYDDSQIERLIGLENKTGLTAFPRYLIHNPLYSIIENFCWENRLYLEYFDDPDFPYDIKEVFLSDSKRRITKAYDFLTIFDTVNSAELHQLSSSNAQLFISPQTISSCLIDPANMPQKKINIGQHDNLSSQVWAAFHARQMQKLLYNKAEEFISDYLTLICKIDCTLQSIWALKESHLKTLFDSVSSLYKLNKAIEKTKAKLLKRVEEAEKNFPKVKIISQNDMIGEIKEKISRWAPNPSVNRFLITGEKGTGKQLFANAIHAAIGGKGDPIKVNCAAIPQHLFESEIFGHMKGSFTGADKDKKGKLEAAEGGTVFFDEFKHLSLDLQAKMLCVLQDRKFMRVGGLHEIPLKCKLVFATNEPLPKLIEEKKFHPDLYDRIKGFELRIPPLRDRKEDIPILIEHFIKERAKTNPELKDVTITKSCIKFLKSLDWDGNIRDIESLIDYVIANRDKDDISEIAEEDLPDFITKSNGTQPPKSKKKKNLKGNKKFEDSDLEYWMNELGNNKMLVAKQLRVTWKTIWLRWKKMGGACPTRSGEAKTSKADQQVQSLRG